MKRIQYPLFLIILSLGCSSQTSDQKFCDELKAYSKKTDLSIFDIIGMKYSDIDTGSYRSANKYQTIRKYLPDGDIFFYSHLNDDNCSLILLSKVFLNSPMIKLHLLNLTDDPSTNDKLLISEKSIYSGGKSEMKSVYKGDVLTITRIDGYVGDYIEEEDRHTSIVDSVTLKYKFIDGFFKETSRDSVRLEK